jgi:hypothetical protein
MRARCTCPQVAELTANQMERFKLEADLASTTTQLATLQAGSSFMTPAEEAELKALRVKVAALGVDLERTGG